MLTTASLLALAFLASGAVVAALALAVHWEGADGARAGDLLV